MLQWINENVGTILICMGLIVIVALIVRSLIRQKKQGKSSCGAGCAHCAMHGQCHTGGRAQKVPQGEGHGSTPCPFPYALSCMLRASLSAQDNGVGQERAFPTGETLC